MGNLRNSIARCASVAQGSGVALSIGQPVVSVGPGSNARHRASRRGEDHRPSSLARRRNRRSIIAYRPRGMRAEGVVSKFLDYVVAGALLKAV